MLPSPPTFGLQTCTHRKRSFDARCSSSHRPRCIGRHRALAPSPLWVSWSSRLQRLPTTTPTRARRQAESAAADASSVASSDASYASFVVSDGKISRESASSASYVEDDGAAPCVICGDADESIGTLNRCQQGASFSTDRFLLAMQPFVVWGWPTGIRQSASPLQICGRLWSQMPQEGRGQAPSPLSME